MIGRLAIQRVALPPSYLKTCTRCQQELPRSNFSLDYRRADCYQSWCNACQHRQRGSHGPKAPPGAIRLPRTTLAPDALKRCSSCRQELPPSSFYRDKARADGLAAACRSCRILGDRLYASENGDALLERRRKRRASRGSVFRNYQLKWTHGITLDQYNQMLVKQDGVCAICRGPQVAPHKHLCVDHCHTTGRIRGLLCSPCNKGLGLLRDNTETLKAAVRYLGDR